LPPLPFAPKLIAMPSVAQRHVKYETTSLVENTQYPLLIDDEEMGMPIDSALIQFLSETDGDRDGEWHVLTNSSNQLLRYLPHILVRATPNVRAEDQALMVPAREDASNLTAGGTRRPLVTWLRRSEYIQADSRTSTTKTETIEANFAYSARTAPQRTYETREDQLEGIERTFELPAQIQHPRKKHLKVKATYPIFPDSKLEDNVYTIAQFTANPSADDRQIQQQPDDNTDRGIFRPISNPHDPSDSYLIWFLPDEQSTRRLKRKKENAEESLGSEVSSNASFCTLVEPGMTDFVSSKLAFAFRCCTRLYLQERQCS
jgi:RNA polymerase II-associated factor 1